MIRLFHYHTDNSRPESAEKEKMESREDYESNVRQYAIPHIHVVLIPQFLAQNFVFVYSVDGSHLECMRIRSMQLPVPSQ